MKGKNRKEKRERYIRCRQEERDRVGKRNARSYL